MSLKLITDRVVIRDWDVDDADDALAVYGSAKVVQWLPTMDRVADAAAMRSVMQAWVESQPSMLPPCGRWALQRRDDGALIGGMAIRQLPPYDEDFEISVQLRPDLWGRGYAREGLLELARWAFTHDVDELFAVARPGNERALAAMNRLGLSWVGETSKYYDTPLQVFRIRPSDLD